MVDPFVKERGFPKATMKMIEFRNKYESLFEHNEFMWCKYCEWYVTKSSKHCRACNRCTSHFDHHCRWLNNCVSKQNYKAFFVAICSTELLLLYEIILGILMIFDQIDASNHVFIKFENMTFIHTLIALQIFMAIFMALPLLQLITFHIYLYKKQISTYDWVVSREKKIKLKREKTKEKYSTEKKEDNSNNTKKIETDKLNQKCPKNDEDEDEEEEDEDSKHEDSLTITDDTMSDKFNTKNGKMKTKIISKSKKQIKRALRKYFYSLRDCESRFNRKNVREQMKAPNLTNGLETDVKLSGLETDDTTKEIDESDTIQTSVLCSIKICHCDDNGKLRKRNSIHVSQKYSHSEQKNGKSTDKHDAVLFGTDPTSDTDLDTITETEMVTISNQENQTQNQNINQNITLKPNEDTENTNSVQPSTD